MEDFKLIDLIYDLKKKCTDMEEALMKENNLTQSELQFFMSMDNCESISSRELATSMDISISRISRIIDKLVNHGLLNREVDPKDRRAINISLTTKGQETKRVIEEYREKCEQRLISHMAKIDVQKLKLNLLKLSDAF